MNQKGILLTSISLLFAICSVNMAYAEQTDLGSMNITPCSRQGGYHDDLGIWWPTIDTAEQRAYLRLTYTVPNRTNITGLVNSCDQQSVATATLASLITNLSAAAPTFWATFSACMGSRYSELYGAEIKVDSQCMW